MGGYLCLISFEVLGAGYSPVLTYPSFDAYIEPFPIFFFEVPIVILAVLIMYAVEIRRIRRFDLTLSAYVAVSIYLL